MEAEDHELRAEGEASILSRIVPPVALTFATPAELASQPINL